MQCPVCSAELEPGALSCPACHAIQIVERTPLGVVTGWLGVVSAVLTAMVVIGLIVLVIAGISLKGFPWILVIVGGIMTGGFLGYSRKTRHLAWRPARD
jgi:hypothetical protein